MTLRIFLWFAWKSKEGEGLTAKTSNFHKDGVGRIILVEGTIYQHSKGIRGRINEYSTCYTDQSGSTLSHCDQWHFPA